MGLTIYIIILIVGGVVNGVWAFEDEMDSNTAFEELCRIHDVSQDGPSDDETDIIREEVVINRMPEALEGEEVDA